MRSPAFRLLPAALAAVLLAAPPALAVIVKLIPLKEVIEGEQLIFGIESAIAQVRGHEHRHQTEQRTDDSSRGHRGQCLERLTRKGKSAQPRRDCGAADFLEFNSAAVPIGPCGSGLSGDIRYV